MKRSLTKAIGSLLAVGTLCSAGAAVFTDTYGSSADFILNDNNTLTIVLTSGRNATSFGSVLTALFFNANTLFTPLSATTSGALVGTGAPLLNPFTGNVGGEWDYIGGSSELAFGARQGISSTGLGIFGAPNFNGLNLFGPDVVDGGQFGIVASENGANLGLSQSLQVQNSVTFTLAVDNRFSLDSISDVTLFYGTSLSETSVPDSGSTLTMLGFALIGAESLRRKFFRT